MADTDTPKPMTAIPELVAMPLRDDEFKTIADAMEVVDGLLVETLRHKGGASLRCRIELAVAVLVGAIDHGRDAAIETGQMEPDAAMGLVVDLVERRAMEIWGQGGA
jgi:hypothetical protein